MLMPSLSGSAYHRRRSLRGRSNPLPPFREPLKENDPYSHAATASNLKTPAQCGSTYTLQAPSVLSSRNAAPSAVRELFTTPRTPAIVSNDGAVVNGTAVNAQLNAYPQAAWRTPSAAAAPVVNPAHNNLPSIDVHAGRVVYAVLGASGIGTLSLNLLSHFLRIVLYPSFSGGLFWFLLCTLLMIINMALFFLFLGMSENVFSAEHPRLKPHQVLPGLRYILWNRSRRLQFFCSGCCAAGVVFSVSFCIGAVYRNNLYSALYPMWIGFACGLTHSYLSQITGVFTWRFSPTRETVIKRVRGELLFATVLALSATFLGWFVAYVSMGIISRFIYSTSLTPAKMLLVSSKIHFATTLSVFMSMAAFCLVCAVYMHMMTVAMNVRDHISDSLNSTLQSKERAVSTVHRLLADIAPENRKYDGLIALNRMLGIQFFRDVARTSRAGRRIIFEDSDSILWNGIMQGCVEPVKDLTQELTKVVSNPNRDTSVPIEFADGRNVAWACETLSHFLVASRDEDDFGIVQRQFVHVIMCLLALKHCVESAREQRRIQRTATSLRSLPNSKLSMTLQSPQDIYFDIDVVAATVRDAVDLALVRIVDAFRAHLKGFLAGAEPHWDPRFDRSLSAVLESSH